MIEPAAIARGALRLAGRWGDVARLVELTAPARPHIEAFIDEPVLPHLTRAASLLDPNIREIIVLLQGLRAALEGDEPPWTVARYQAFLAKRGLYSGRIDGDARGLTRAAVRAYQAEENLMIDGEVGPATSLKMRSQGA